MIDANSKTNSFLEAIEQYAEQQRSEMRAEVETFREEQLRAANEEGTAAAFAYIQEQKHEFKASLAKEKALKETKKKRELFEKRSKMAQEIFDEAQKKLEEEQIKLSDREINYYASGYTRAAKPYRTEVKMKQYG